jgi:hypothetical protein
VGVLPTIVHPLTEIVVTSKGNYIEGSAMMTGKLRPAEVHKHFDCYNIYNIYTICMHG